MRLKVNGMSRGIEGVRQVHDETRTSSPTLQEESAARRKS
jgi:hypothetical protein